MGDVRKRFASAMLRRRFSAADLLANGIGAALGVMIFALSRDVALAGIGGLVMAYGASTVVTGMLRAMSRRAAIRAVRARLDDGGWGSVSRPSAPLRKDGRTDDGYEAGAGGDLGTEHI
jgi:hypothetical protein